VSLRHRNYLSFRSTENARLDPQPFWGHEDVGAFFLLIVSPGLILRLLARLHFLSRSAIIDPGVGLIRSGRVFGHWTVLRSQAPLPATST
jgi:hypothetical protein